MATPPPRRRRTPPPPPRRHRPVPRAPQSSRWGRRLTLLAALVLLPVFGSIALRLVYTDRALPGTTLAGTSVEGDSRTVLKERMTRLAASPVTVFAAGKQLRITPVAAGYEQDVEATVERVLDAGRTGPLLGLSTTLKGLVTTRDVAPVDRIDPVRLDDATRSVARLVNRVAYPGGIRVDPETFAVTVQGPRQGRTVDRPALGRQLVAALRSAEDQFRAPFRSSPVATMVAVRAVGAEAERYLREPLTLTGAGDRIVLERDRLAPILRLRASRKDRTQVRLGSDEPALKALIAGIAATRDRPSREPRFSAPGRLAVLDGKGTVSWRPRAADVSVTEAGRSGRTIERERALEAIATAVRTGRHTVRLPVRTAKPKVTEEQARKVDRLIGTFTTRYEAGQPRVRNIRRMADTVDGTVVAPGGQFSLNGVVGQRTKDGGYVEAPFIAEGRIVPSVGGGVSQFSTTLYNAAYFAGLRINTHQPHSLFISRYPPGREATLNFPDIDLRWTNDTGAPVLVRTASDETSVTVSLYGDNGGRRVTARPGPREPFPGGDFQITVERTIRHGGGRTTKDRFTTRYDNPVEE